MNNFDQNSKSIWDIDLLQNFRKLLRNENLPIYT